MLLKSPTGIHKTFLFLLLVTLYHFMTNHLSKKKKLLMTEVKLFYMQKITAVAKIYDLNH